MSAIEFVQLGPGEYDRAKTIFNKAKHPGFIGRELFYRCATTGTVTVATLEGIDSGIAMIAKEKLQALSVVTSAQGRGVGPALMRRLQPKWVSAIGERIGFFEKLGYKAFGSPKVGQNGKHATQLMERGEMPTAANDDGSGGQRIIADPIEPEKTADTPLRSLVDLADDTPEEREMAQLEIFDGLLLKAIAAERFESALKILEAAGVAMRQRDHAKRKAAR